MPIRYLWHHFKASSLTLEIIRTPGLLLLLGVYGRERDHAADTIDDTLRRKAMEKGPQGRKACDGDRDASFDEGPENAQAFEAKLVGGGETE